MLNSNYKFILQVFLTFLCFGMFSMFMDNSSKEYIPARKENVDNIYINFQGIGKINLKPNRRGDGKFRVMVHVFNSKSKSKRISVSYNWKLITPSDLVLNLNQLPANFDIYSFIPEICIGFLFLFALVIILSKTFDRICGKRFHKHKDKKDRYWFRKMKQISGTMKSQKTSVDIGDVLISDREDDYPTSSNTGSQNTTVYLPPSPEKVDFVRSNEKVIAYISKNFPSCIRKYKRTCGFEIFSILISSIILLVIITIFSDIAQFYIKEVHSIEDFSFSMLDIFVPVEKDIKTIDIFCLNGNGLQDKSKDFDSYARNIFEDRFKCHIVNEIKNPKFFLKVFDVPKVSNNNFILCQHRNKCFMGWPEEKRFSCNPKDTECICPRGYKLHKGNCLDENECKIAEFRSLCNGKWSCVNTIGSHHCKCNLSGFQFASNCIICQQCPPGTYDINQCLLPTETRCIDATEPVKRVIQKSENIKSVISIKTADNVFGEDVLKTTKLKSNLQFYEFNGRSSENFIRHSKLVINITLLNFNLLPTFEDVHHKSDNDFILNSSQGSNLHHLKKPLLQIMKNYCRHPIPESYFITMTKYNNRHTKVKKCGCDQDNYSSNKHCQLRPTDYQSFCVRSLNDQCSKNKAVYLPKEPNSFYCVKNNKFINQIFQHHLRESVSAHPDDTCDFARRKCNTCLNLNKQMCLKNIELKQNKSVEENCCLSKCLNNKNCQKMYSTQCHYQDLLLKGLDKEICMQGDTVKFSLNPQFQFKNNKFKCHVRKQSQTNVLKIVIQFHIQDAYSPGRHWSSNFIIKEIPFRDPGHFNSGNISIQWSSKLTIQSEMILQGYQNSNNAEQFFSLSKIDRNSNVIMPKVQRHGDKSYVEVEFENIFEYSTSNWNDLSCELNSSKIRPINKKIDLVNSQNVIPISIIQNSENKPFVYVLKSAIEDPEIEIKIKENSSLLRSLFCVEIPTPSGKIVKDSQNEAFNAHLSQHKWPNQWNLLVEGYVSHDATFVNIQITDISTGTLISNFEQIVFSQLKSTFRTKPGEKNQSKIPVEFATYFHLDLHHLFATETKIIQIALVVQVQDCFTTYRKNIYHFPHHSNQLRSGNQRLSAEKYLPLEKKSELHINQISFHKEMYHFLLQYLAIITFSFSVIYLFIIVALIIIRICSKTDQKTLMQKIYANYRKSLNQTCNQNATQSISRKRRMVLFLFVTFKVFYNFVFTLSVGLSLILSLESNLSPFEITPSRLLYSIEQEVQKLDNFCSDELRRQNEFKNSMYKACYDKRKKCELSMKSQMKTKFESIIDPWIAHAKRPIYKSISDIFHSQCQNDLNAFYNYSKQIIDKQIHHQIHRYNSFIDEFSHLLYLKTGINFYSNASTKFNQTLKYNSVWGKEIKSLDSQSIIDVYEPLAILGLYISFSNEYSKLERKSPKSESILSSDQFHFKEVSKSKTKRYFQSTFKVPNPKTDQTSTPLEAEINRFYKNRMKIIAKSNRFQLKISLWHMRLVIVFIDLIIITYRFYHTLKTIKIIWFGSHIHLSFNYIGKFQNKENMESNIAYPAFQYVKFKQFIRNSPSMEIAELGLSINKIFPCFYCCKRLYYICIIISLTLLVGMVSLFLLSFYCIGRSQINMPSMVADTTLQYLNQRVNWITTKHGIRINEEKLKTSVLSDYNNRINILWLQKFFNNEENQIQQNIQDQICTLSSTNPFYGSLKPHCNHNSVGNPIHCSIQPCYFINLKALNYSETQILKEMFTADAMATSFILIPLLRFMAVAILVVSAVLIMLGIIYHSSKLLALIFLTFSEPINATILNKNFPLLSKSILKQHFTHSTSRLVTETFTPIFINPNRTAKHSPRFLKGLPNICLSPVLSCSTHGSNNSESRV